MCLGCFTVRGFVCLPGRTGSDGTLLNVALISYSVYIEAPTLAHLLIHAQNARNFYADSPRSLIFSLFFLKSPRISAGAGSPAGFRPTTRHLALYAAEFGSGVSSKERDP